MDLIVQCTQTLAEQRPLVEALVHHPLFQIHESFETPRMHDGSDEGKLKLIYSSILYVSPVVFIFIESIEVFCLKFFSFQYSVAG